MIFVVHPGAMKATLLQRADPGRLKQFVLTGMLRACCCYWLECEWAAIEVSWWICLRLGWLEEGCRLTDGVEMLQCDVRDARDVTFVLVNYL